MNISQCLLMSFKEEYPKKKWSRDVKERGLEFELDALITNQLLSYTVESLIDAVGIGYRLKCNECMDFCCRTFKAQ